jgi:hypothetical protein
MEAQILVISIIIVIGFVFTICHLETIIKLLRDIRRKL